MHSYYTNNSKKIYIEVPSIVAEIALISKYNLSYQNYRIKELIRNKNHLNNENIDYKMLIDISYSLGMLISIPFIYKYGNDLNIILDAINNIIENDNKNFSLILNELDINDNDIMDSFKNINKILKI